MDENSMLSIFNRENRLLLLVFFSENLKLLFLQLGGEGRGGGDFSSCLVLFVLSVSLLLRKYFCFSPREGN